MVTIFGIWIVCKRLPIMFSTVTVRGCLFLKGYFASTTSQLKKIIAFSEVAVLLKGKD